MVPAFFVAGTTRLWGRSRAEGGRIGRSRSRAQSTQTTGTDQRVQSATSHEAKQRSNSPRSSSPRLATKKPLSGAESSIVWPLLRCLRAPIAQRAASALSSRSTTVSLRRLVAGARSAGSGTMIMAPLGATHYNNAGGAVQPKLRSHHVYQSTGQATTDTVLSQCTSSAQCQQHAAYR